MAQKGYIAARVSDICQAAGVTRPVFYELFEGKDDAFLAAYRHGIKVLLRVMDAAYQEAGSWCGGIRAALSALLGTLASVPAFATMAVVEIEAAGPAARRERDQMLRRFDRFFARAPGQPGLPAPTELVGCVVGGIYQTLYRYIACGRVAELPALLPTLTYFALVPFLGREQSARQVRLGQDEDPHATAPCAPEGALSPAPPGGPGRPRPLCPRARLALAVWLDKARSAAISTQNALARRSRRRPDATGGTPADTGQPHRRHPLAGPVQRPGERRFPRPPPSDGPGTARPV